MEARDVTLLFDQKSEPIRLSDFGASTEQLNTSYNSAFNIPPNQRSESPSRQLVQD